MKENQQSEEVYKFFDVDVVSEKEGHVLIRSRRNAHSRWVTLPELEFLFSCRGFESLVVHATNYARQMKLEQQRNRKSIWQLLPKFLSRDDDKEETIPHVRVKELSPFLEQLQEFAAEEYLVSESWLLKKIHLLAHEGRQQRVPEADKIDVIGIPTCNRSESLKRCLRSFMENFNFHQRNPDIVILDDSHTTEAQQQNRAVLIALKRSYPGRIRYINRERRQRFARAVARHTGMSPVILEFALMGHPSCYRSEGGCRNAYLLLTQGRLALQTDDDTICKPARPPVSNPGLKLTSTLSSDNYWFFKSHLEALEAVHFIEADFLALHEQLLGKNPLSVISSCLTEGIRPDVGDLSPSFLGKLKSRNAKIRMTLPGPAGDTCMYTDLYRLFLGGESLERLITPPEDYDWHLSTRQVVRSVTRTVISDITRCIGMNFAVDNRSILPPFMPVQARCDGIFGDLIAVSFPEAYAGNIPWVLPHQPPDPRARSVDNLFSMLESIRINDIVSILLFAIKNELEDKDSSENLRSAGRLLMDLGRMPDRQFSNEIRHLYTMVLEQTVQMGKQALFRNSDTPKEWKNHVQRYMKGVEKSILETDFLIPVDIDKPTSPDKQDFKDIVHLFGELLTCWPDIYKSIQTMTEDDMEAYVETIRL